MDLNGRSLLTVTDLSAAELTGLVDLARELRIEKRLGFGQRQLDGMNIALIFERASARTRAAFEVAAHDEGAHVTYLGPGEAQLGYEEMAEDTARVLGRMYDGIACHGVSQETAQILAACSGGPVWNGRTDDWDPAQLLADILTVTDHCAKPLPEVSLCYLGDGRSSTASSLLVAGGLLGMDVRICSPAALRPSQDVQLAAGRLAPNSGARLTVTGDVRSAVAGADFLYTGAWLPADEPEEEREARIDQLLSYQVNAGVLAATGNPDVKFLHCLPARRNRDTDPGQWSYRGRRLTALEVTDDVFASPASVVFDQAENRLHTIKALMVATLGRKA